MAAVDGAPGAWRALQQLNLREWPPIAVKPIGIDVAVGRQLQGRATDAADVPSGSRQTRSLRGAHLVSIFRRHSEKQSIGSAGGINSRIHAAVIKTEINLSNQDRRRRPSPILHSHCYTHPTSRYTPQVYTLSVH